MGMIMRYGDGAESVILSADVGAASPPAFVISDPSDMRGYNVQGAQLIATGIPVQVNTATGSVVGSTKVFTFTGFDFTTYVGGLLSITGPAGSALDANINLFPISAGTNGTVTVTVPHNGVGPATETFAMSGGIYILAYPPATVDGTWKVEVSNDFVPKGGGTSYGQPPNKGQWTDITSQFVPAIADVAHGTASSLSQYVQAEISCRTVQYSFTRSAGTGHVLAIVFSKTNG